MQLIDKVLAPSWWVEGWFFSGPCAQAHGRGEGHVHRDMAPIIRGICWLGWLDALVEHTVRTTTTTPHNTTHENQRSGPIGPRRIGLSRPKKCGHTKLAQVAQDSRTPIVTVLITWVGQQVFGVSAFWVACACCFSFLLASWSPSLNAS